MYLNPAPLSGAAAVVCLRGDVLDARDLEAGGLEAADRGLAARPRALHEDLDLLHALLDALARGGVSRHLRGEGGRLARALETGAAGGLPRDHVPLAVGQRDDRVVERSLDVRLADRDVLLDLAAGARGAFRCGHLLLPCLLLARHLHALGTLARAGVGLGVLTSHRQAAPVAQAAVAADLHQALDVLRALAAQVTLDHVVTVDDVAQLRHLVVREVPDLAVRLDPELGEDLVRGRPADAVDVRQADLDALVEGDVDAGDASHCLRAPSALPLLVAGVLADHKHPPVAADDLALLTHRLDRRSYLHGPFRLMIQTGWLWRPFRPPLPCPRSGHTRKPPGSERGSAG